jgi:16S rRNA (cytidine1402-2'-O)-methyltransferase
MRSSGIVRGISLSKGHFHIHGHAIVAKSLSPGLHIVSTPIGNLGDITLRALETLAAADVILAEDTRVSRGLLTHYGIATPLQSYHEHSGPAAIEAVIARLKDGAALALISDAGTPILSDPGAALVKAAIEAGLTVSPVPGASALLAALVASGMVEGAFHFAGFLPARPTERRQALKQLSAVPGLIAFYEAPHRLVEMLDDAASLLGNRMAMVAREMTKRFETTRHGPLLELASHYRDTEAPRGEIVVLIAASDGAIDIGPSLDERLIAALLLHSIKDAAQIVAGATGLKKREVYARALELQAAKKTEAE